MVQDSTGGFEAISNVLVLEGADGNFIYSREKNLSKSLVGAIILVEECGGGVEIIAKFGDWAPVELAGIMGTDLGLTGTIKGLDYKVL